MRRLLTLLMSVGLIVAACSSADEGADESTTTAAHGSETTEAASDETTTTEAEDEPTTTAAAETTTTAAPASAGGPSCIEGDWLFGTEGFVEAMRSAMTAQDLEGTDIASTDGTYTISFASDGTYTGVREDWGWSVATPDGTIVIAVSGEETGMWSADDSTITVTIEASDVQVSASVEADGQTFELPNSPVEVPEAIAESSSYQCDSDTLTVTTGEFTFQLDRA
ncbi:MAG: hypothetical protein PVJ28_04450 [Acidimicrobiia bacterium]|jgi:hypothetical protein